MTPRPAVQLNISVVVTSYNYGPYLRACIDSVFSQSSPAYEIVVVDDGSEDGSLAILDSYGPAIVVLAQENAGVAAATTAGIDACSGDIICLLDADDVMYPHRLATLEAIYGLHRDIEWVFHPLHHVDAQTRRVLASPAPRRFRTGKVDVRQRAERGDMSLPVIAPATSGLSWRRTFLTGLMPIPKTVLSQDNYLKFASFATALGYCHPEPLGAQGIHHRNLYTARTDNQIAFRANNAVATAVGYARLPYELNGVGDRLIADAIVLDRKRTALGADYRAMLKAHLTSMSTSRRLRVRALAARITIRRVAVAILFSARRAPRDSVRRLQQCRGVRRRNHSR